MYKPDFSVPINDYIHEACWLATQDGLVMNYAAANCCTNVSRALYYTAGNNTEL
jgi:nitrogenase subunit NifH